MATLKDNRKYQAMTIAEADAIFLQIAKLKADIDRKTADHKKRLADLEAKLAADLQESITLKAEKEKLLASYILANPERFQKPRKHCVGQIGAYGITTDPAFVEITDADSFIQYAMEQGYEDLLNVTRKVDKDAAKERFLAGETLPGAKLIPAGDAAKLTFKKGYAELLEKKV